MGLEQIQFDPSESVTYMPENSKQTVTMTIKNNGNSSVIFKWKSTRPGVYKMRPVYGRVPAGDHTNVQLIFKGIKPGTTVPMKDHYTCIFTVSTSSSADVQKIWKNHKHKREMANHAIRKHNLKILYKGHNDQEVEMTPLENDITEARNKVRIRKGKGLVDEEDEKPAAAVAPAQKEKIQLVFREQACPLSDSDSDKEQEDDEDGHETKSVTKSVVTKSSMSRPHAVAAASDASSTPTAAINEMATAPEAKLATRAPATSGSKGEVKTSQPPTDVSGMKTAPPAKLAPPATTATTPGGLSQMKTAPPAKLAPPATTATTATTPGGLSQMKTAPPAKLAPPATTATTPGGPSQMKTAPPMTLATGLSQMKTAPPAAIGSTVPTGTSQMKTAAVAPIGSVSAPGGPSQMKTVPVAPVGSTGVSQMATAPPAKLPGSDDNQKKK